MALRRLQSEASIARVQVSILRLLLTEVATEQAAFPVRERLLLLLFVDLAIEVERKLSYVIHVLVDALASCFSGRRRHCRDLLFLCADDFILRQMLLRHGQKFRALEPSIIMVKRDARARLNNERRLVLLMLDGRKRVRRWISWIIFEVHSCLNLRVQDGKLIQVVLCARIRRPQLVYLMLRLRSW